MPRVVALFQRLLPIKQVSDRVGLSRSTIYDMMARNEFPRPVDTSSTHTVRWVESEVNNWITERIKERDARLTHAGRTPNPSAPSQSIDADAINTSATESGAA